MSDKRFDLRNWLLGVFVIFVALACIVALFAMFEIYLPDTIETATFGSMAEWALVLLGIPAAFYATLQYRDYIRSRERDRIERAEQRLNEIAVRLNEDNASRFISLITTQAREIATSAPKLRMRTAQILADYISDVSSPSKTTVSKVISTIAKITRLPNDDYKFQKVKIYGVTFMEPITFQVHRNIIYENCRFFGGISRSKFYNCVFTNCQHRKERFAYDTKFKNCSFQFGSIDEDRRKNISWQKPPQPKFVRCCIVKCVFRDVWAIFSRCEVESGFASLKGGATEENFVFQRSWYFDTPMELGSYRSTIAYEDYFPVHQNEFADKIEPFGLILKIGYRLTNAHLTHPPQ